MGGDRRRYGASSISLCFTFPRKDLSPNPELVTLQRGWQPASPFILPAFTYPRAATIGLHAHAWLFTWLVAGDPDIGPQACAASALTR